MLGKALGTISVIFLLLTVVAWGLSFSAYNPTWQLKYAEQHLNIAKDATDSVTALYELQRAREILSSFPKEGNYDIFSTMPSAELSKAWEALDNTILYCESIQQLTDLYQINHAMEEMRVRLTGFMEDRWIAFTSVPCWNNGGYFSFLAILFYCLSAVLSFGWLEGYDDPCHWIAGFLWIFLIIIGITALIFDVVPIFYSGVR